MIFNAACFSDNAFYFYHKLLKQLFLIYMTCGLKTHGSVYTSSLQKLYTCDYFF